MLKVGKYSLGMGDRFAHQAKAQLKACIQASEHGVDIVPVWNKSHREHITIGSEPASAQTAAAAAVNELAWKKAYHIDADHIRLETVDPFIPHSDFFTIDVADSIGRPAGANDIAGFASRHRELTGRIEIPGIEQPFETSASDVERIAGKYLSAVQEAGQIYRHIADSKGADNLITEISMDETDTPQTPAELLVILAAISDEQIPVQTIAPKFTGRFNKGVDYVGDVSRFEREFNQDLAVIAFAIQTYSLPETLKLSVHSGSDKFSIYGPIRKALSRFDAGVHLKTAGTTWLEEVIGLAESGGDGLTLAKEIYSQASAHVEALCAPYATVIDIDSGKLPPTSQVNEWTSEQFVQALRHEPGCPTFNPHIRQLLHVGYKMAAQVGKRYLDMLDACEASVSRNVTHNLFERHIKPLFISE